MTTRHPNNRLTIILLIDALGWEVVREFGFCEGLLERSGPLDTVLGYSSAAIPSLLSGKPPATHGSWAMYRYAPADSPFKLFRYIPKLPHALEWRLRAMTRRYMARRETIKGYYDLYEIPLRVLGHFDVAQRGDPYMPGGMPVETMFDCFESGEVSYRVWTYRTPEAENFEELAAWIRSDASVLFLYTAELDALMHRVGVRDAAVGDKLAWYEQWLRKWLGTAAAAGRETSVMLFSDHGMTDVRDIVDVEGRVESMGFRMGRDGLAFYDSTMARFWSRGTGAEELRNGLNGTGWGHVLTSEELERFGCDFGDVSYGEIIFLVDPGYLILPSFMSKEPVAAMHGYDPGDPFSRGCFMTNDPVCPLPESILGIKDLVVGHVTGRD